MDGVNFNILSVEEREALEVRFSLDDVKAVIWGAGGDKSLGPNRFNLGFFKVCWEIVKSDLFKMVTGFYDNPVLHKAVVASLLALNPKVENLVLVEDFRPICLIRSFYRILLSFL